MKAWEPDENFGKADFPSKKSETKPSSAPRRAEGAKPSPPADGGARPAANGPVRPAAKADARSTPASAGDARASRPSESDASKASTSGEARPVAWQPPRIERAEAARDGKAFVPSRPATDAGAETTNGRAPAPRDTKSAPAPARSTPVQDPDRASQSVRLVQEAALAAPENALRFLRRWYWEKWPGEDRSGVRSVPPHDRIRIVLATVGDKVVQYLFRMMSPVERTQFNDILKKTGVASAATASLVCRAFMNGVREEGQ